MSIGSSPLPDLQYYPNSGLSFRWAEVIGTNGCSTFDWHLGNDGVGLGLQIYVYWEDIQTAIQEILGYSYRQTISHSTQVNLKRVLPWQHPYFNQLYAKTISSVLGMQTQGNEISVIPGGGPLLGRNLGPWSNWTICKLTIGFWRPPYYVRTDAAITVGGVQQEWERYVETTWQVDNQILSREGQVYKFLNVSNGVNGFPGSIGQMITHSKVIKKWYDIPEAAIFQTIPPNTTNVPPYGIPYNLLFTQTATTNPITSTGIFIPYVYPIGSPMGGCVNSPSDGSTSTAANLRFFGFPTGTLRYDAVMITPKPLPMPAYLMKIPLLSDGEPISQQQYDIEFHFDYFDPPPANIETNRGHNLMYWNGNGFWNSVRSSMTTNGTTNGTGPFTTPFQYGNFFDVFKIL